jgi:hypothetical protein
MRRFVLACACTAVLVSGCGDKKSPVAPTPTPPPTCYPEITATVTDSSDTYGQGFVQLLMTNTTSCVARNVSVQIEWCGAFGTLSWQEIGPNQSWATGLALTGPMDLDCHRWIHLSVFASPAQP